jgi:hypothetical protein
MVMKHKGRHLLDGHTVSNGDEAQGWTATLYQIHLPIDPPFSLAGMWLSHWTNLAIILSVVAKADLLTLSTNQHSQYSGSGT